MHDAKLDESVGGRDIECYSSADAAAEPADRPREFEGLRYRLTHPSDYSSDLLMQLPDGGTPAAQRYLNDFNNMLEQYGAPSQGIWLMSPKSYWQHRQWRAREQWYRLHHLRRLRARNLRLSLYQDEFFDGWRHSVLSAAQERAPGAEICYLGTARKRTGKLRSLRLILVRVIDEFDDFLDWLRSRVKGDE